MSGSKRKNTGSSDFKRIKAKVGKKAQRQHDTDVSFQSASLHLGQSIQRDNEPKKSGNLLLLVSSRGNSLYHLVSTASTHPAGAARASALKGVLDIVKKHPTDALLPNLSTLIPICVHSCVDEDHDVRSVGFDALSALFQQLQEKRIKPFGALLIARISSALHSLDASIRIHGVKMVNLLSTTCPSLTISFVDKLLPPFSGLLADQRSRKAIDEILQSLITVLRVNKARYADISTNSPARYQRSSSRGDGDVEVRRIINDQQPDLIYLTGGRSRNAILRNRRSVHALPNTIESISHLSHLERTSDSFNLQKKDVNNARKKSSRDDWFGIKCKTSLMSKLRDCLIESINLEPESTITSINRTTRSLTTEPQGSTNYPRVILLLRSIQYLSRSFENNDEEILDDGKLEFDKVTHQIVSVLMDIFPVDQNPSCISSPKDSKSPNIDHINAAIAMSILELSQKSGTNNEIAENDNTTNWMKMICSYVIPRIGHLTNDESVTSSSDLDLTCKFLRRLGTDLAFSDDIDSALDIIQDLFFCNKHAQSARSIGGRRISMIMMDLIDFTNYSLTDELKSPMSKAFHHFLTIMPFYLEAWDADFVYESRRILEGLHRLVREVKGSSDVPLVESIRDNWCKLVANRGDSASIFEMYPWNLQKIYLGLMVLLEKPSDQSLKHLASICCRSTLKSDTFVKNEAVSHTIIEAIQKIRKSIPMQRYLAFLFQSIGISRHVNEVLRFETMSSDRDLDPCSKTVFEGAFFTADSALDRVARALVEPGHMQVLRMILPQLSSWQQAKLDEGASSTEFLFKMRASHIILAYFFLIKHSKQENELDDQPSIFDLTKGDMTVNTVSHSICTFMNCIACNEAAMDSHLTLISPIVAIMSSEHVVLNAVVCKMSDLFRKPGLSKIEQKNLILIMIDWMKDPRLQNSMAALPSSSKVFMEQLLANSRDVLQQNELLPAVVPQRVTK
jgi:hypothetical protein